MAHDAPRPTQLVSDEFVDEIATLADTDRRSVIRRLAGLSVKGRAGMRIDRVLASRGVLPPSQPPPSSTQAA